MRALTPRISLFHISDLARLDDVGLRTFVASPHGEVSPRELGLALVGCDDTLVQRVSESLPAEAAAVFASAHAGASERDSVLRARRLVLAQLFWPLVYWLRPDDFEELIRGEEISPRLLSEIDIDDRIVCDIGAGTGRFTMYAAPRARRVVAVDGVPALLERLAAKLPEHGCTNVDLRRGAFTALPVDDASVDVAVACSAFTTRGPHGGEAALDEAERIVRPGGDVAVIWPQDRDWLVRRGYRYVQVRGEGAVRFRDVATAARLCADYYSTPAAHWVRTHNRADVPYGVLGVRPPTDMCIRTMPD